MREEPVFRFVYPFLKTEYWDSESLAKRVRKVRPRLADVRVKGNGLESDGNVPSPIEIELEKDPCPLCIGELYSE